MSEALVTTAWTKERAEGFRAAFYDFLKNVKIVSKELVGQQHIKLYGAQRRFLDAVFRGLEKDARSIYALKARQLGLSTISYLLSVFYVSVFEGIQGAIAFDTESNRDKFRTLIDIALESLPDTHKIELTQNNRGGLVFANASTLDFLIAGEKKTARSANLGQGKAYNFLHACAAPGTPVIVEHGRVKKIEDVEIGDKVLTHTGAWANVIDAVGQPNNKGDLIKITPWLGHGLCFTAEHTIPTNRGIVEAHEVRYGDYLVMPLRRILKTQFYITLPSTPGRRQNGGSISVGSGVTMELNEELGFACGYYLAEGHLQFQQHSGRPASITFARHRTEKRYADRAIEAISHVVSGRRTLDRADSLTSVEFVNGASFCSWIGATFGSTDDKRIPDDVFEWGEEFCRGLLCGLLCGDGSKSAERGQGYELPRVTMPTTRSSIAMQARDIAAALGYGWGACSFKDGGHHYGRNCKPCWRIVWCGQAARNIRELMGLPKTRGYGRKWVERYKIQDGLVYLKIRKIERGIKADRIYDLSVDHDDHTFRTPYMSIGNTEVGSWADLRGVRSLERALAEKHPYRLYIWESRANGFNLWHDMCDEAKQDDLSKVFLFIGWWSKEDYSYPKGSPLYERYAAAPITEEEQEKIDAVLRLYQHAVTMEQLAWYRHKSDPNRDKEEGDESEDDDIIEENLPWTESEAFVQSGSNFFSSSVLSEATVKAKQNPFKGFKYVFPEPNPLAVGSEFIAFCENGLQPVTTYKESVLKVWEEPNPHGIYIIGADPAYASSDQADRYCAQILRVYADGVDQVAEYCERSIEIHHFAWILAHLCGAYSNARFLLEINGPGEAVWISFRELRSILTNGYHAKEAQAAGLKNMFNNIRNYVWTRQDSTTGGSNSYHFITNTDRKFKIFCDLKSGMNTGEVNVNSLECLEEMAHMVQDGTSIAASGKRKDDRPMALALANRAWHDSERKRLIAQDVTREKSKRQTMTEEQIMQAFSTDMFNRHLAAQAGARRASSLAAKKTNWLW